MIQTCLSKMSSFFLHCSWNVQMYLMLDALADGGVWAGIPKELSIKLIAHTMLVRNGDFEHNQLLLRLTPWFMIVAILYAFVHTGFSKDGA